MKTSIAILFISMVIFASGVYAKTSNPVNKNGKGQDTQLQKANLNLEVMMQQVQIETENIPPDAHPSLSGLVEKKMTDLQATDSLQKEPDKNIGSR